MAMRLAIVCQCYFNFCWKFKKYYNLSLMFVEDTLLGRDQGDFQKTVLNFESRKQRKDTYLKLLSIQ